MDKVLLTNFPTEFDRTNFIFSSKAQVYMYMHINICVSGRWNERTNEQIDAEYKGSSSSSSRLEEKGSPMKKVDLGETGESSLRLTIMYALRFFVDEKSLLSIPHLCMAPVLTCFLSFVA